MHHPIRRRKEINKSVAPREREEKESGARAVENICATCPGEFQFNNRASERPSIRAGIYERTRFTTHKLAGIKKIKTRFYSCCWFDAFRSLECDDLFADFCLQCKSGGNDPNDFGPDWLRISARRSRGHLQNVWRIIGAAKWPRARARATALLPSCSLAHKSMLKWSMKIGSADEEKQKKLPPPPASKLISMIGAHSSHVVLSHE